MQSGSEVGGCLDLFTIVKETSKKAFFASMIFQPFWQKKVWRLGGHGKVEKQYFSNLVGQFFFKHFVSPDFLLKKPCCWLSHSIFVYWMCPKLKQKCKAWKTAIKLKSITFSISSWLPFFSRLSPLESQAAMAK